nr:hypothetical protein [Spirochaetota bacterium]
MGIVVGLSSTLFLKTLNFTTDVISGKTDFYFLLLPVVFFLNSIVTLYLFPRADVYTTNKIIEYVHKLKDIPALSII